MQVKLATNLADLFENQLDASNFDMARDVYIHDFKNLLLKIYACYEKMLNTENNIPVCENKIRNLLVDNYLSKEISDYTFKKEEKNNLGRVDIYIIDNLYSTKPHFIIECKLLDDKNTDGVQGLNAEYIKNGIQRILTEYYYVENNYFTNAMIGFIVKNINAEDNIQKINVLVEKLLKNLIHIKQNISKDKPNLYQSIYKTLANKEFVVYHLMMDFSQKILTSK